jgi:outer membrane immunogenic protein
MMKRVSISVLCAFVMAQAAAADGMTHQSVTVSSPPFPYAGSGFDWTGGYAGAQIGFGTLRYTGFNSQSGGAVGLFAGYRHDLGTGVVGVEAEYNPATLGTYTIPSGDRLTAGFAVHLSYGVKFTGDERTLLNFQLGPSWARTSLAGNSKTASGYIAGIGVDHMVTDKIIFRGGIRAGFTNNLGALNLKTRSLGAGIGAAYKF